MTLQADAAAHGLTVQRLSPSAWLAAGAGLGAGFRAGCGADADGMAGLAPLGGLAYGVALASASAATPVIAARALSAEGPMVDVWSSGVTPQHAGTCGSVQWRHDGRWLYGALELDESEDGGDLAALGERAYRDVFAALAETGFAHLLRLWNYLPHINAEEGGVERYRQFNAGRQLAFLDAGRPAFEGAPAACAIGTRSGPFCVHFLAGRSAPVAVENPRQVSAYHYPSAYGPRSPTFSRAALVDAGAGRVALLISGTASIVGHHSLHAGDVAAQTRETLANLRAVLQEAQARTTARFDLADLQCTVYVRHAEQLGDIRAEIEAAVGADSLAARTAVYLEADICRSELWVEIEAHAFAPGEVLA